ncbi:hypothetical protein [Cyanobium sp. CH-040]|uniref:hypothetical protein n=1 Tax=Cyanobium sp. CH-040 TaxID=2823708 RepID=UPI0020CC9200|nr:hypothetical protein [Cyanobium sp. CH-040]MCP9927986.1 hypothetical protein [Cyanobium sp. CH-040]
MTQEGHEQEAAQSHCAVIQLEGVHEEVIPSLVLALNACGYKPDVYVNKRCKQQRGDIFKRLKTPLDCTIRYVSITEPQHWKNLARKIKSSGYNFIVLSTYQHESIAKWTAAIDLPIIGLVHNVELFLRSPSCLSSFQAKQAQVLLLAPHVAAFLNQHIGLELVDRTGVVESVYWGENATIRSKTQSEEGRRVAIPGGVNFNVRAFRELVTCLDSYRDFPIRFWFQILGGGPDRESLEKLILENDLCDFFRFSKLGTTGRVRYKTYIKDLRKSDIVLPLVPLANIPYREHKITSAIPTAVGFGVPLMVDRWTARIYRVPAIETDETVSAALKAIVETSNDDLKFYKNEILEYRKIILRKNASEMGRLVGQIA